MTLDALNLTSPVQLSVYCGPRGIQYRVESETDLRGFARDAGMQLDATITRDLVLPIPEDPW